MISFAWGSAIHVGQVRQVNQDNLWTEDGLFAVADGMGGHRGGEVASALALEALREAFTERTSTSLVEAIQTANDRVVEAGDDPELRGMGTTLAVVALVSDGDNEVITIANVGDSRVYLLRAESEELEQVSEDHSLVATLQRQGQLSKDEAASHPQRNIITRALGIDTTVLVDSWDLVPIRGDRYLICSDGLVNEVDDPRIASTLRRLADPAEAAQELVRLANENGGRDNISVVVVDVTEADFALDPAPGRDGESRVVRTGVPDEPFHVTDPTQQVPVVQAPDPPDAPSLDADADAEPEPTAPAAAPPPASPEPRKARRARKRAEADAGPPVGGRSRMTWRVVAFVLAFGVLVAGTVGVIAFAANNTYFVRGDDDGRIAIWKGRPGGVLWIQPALEHQTDLVIADAPVQERRDLESESGKDFGSREEADRYVERIRAGTTTTTTSTTTTSTTTTPTTAAPAPTP